MTQYKNPEMNDQFCVYRSNQVFNLYYKNKDAITDTCYLNLPIRGYLEYNDIKMDIYDNTMTINWKNIISYLKLEYKTDFKIIAYDGIKTYEETCKLTNLNSHKLLLIVNNPNFIEFIYRELNKTKVAEAIFL